MLTLKINGEAKKLNIGCRTFISVAEILIIIKSDAEIVMLNQEKVSNNDFTHTYVKGGDSLRITT